MSETPPIPLWRGRVLALLGILLVASNLRSAVGALSPIFGDIGKDIGLNGVGIGLLGMLPPICFAVFGVVTPAFTRRLSLELVMTIALAVMTVGDVLRAAASNYAVLAIGSAVVFAGMAVGNVLLPPLVKRYFPDRIGLMTSLYATIMAVGTLLPPLIAVPVAGAVGWRPSVGLWGIISVIAILPWLSILVRRRAPLEHDGDVEGADRRLVGRIWHAPLAWALGVVFAVSALNAYAFFTWLPELLHDVAHLAPEPAGALLSLFAAMGIPAALLVPILTARMKRLSVLIYVAVACFVVGYLGLIFVPTVLTWLWVALAGLGPLLFPLALVLINLRTRTHAGSVALSGFVQSLGYTIGALGPLVVGALHEITGGWTWPLGFLLVASFSAVVAGFVVTRPTMLEDQLRSRAVE
jgi:CP family cyanate transporter-like MFS transporter